MNFLSYKVVRNSKGVICLLKSVSKDRIGERHHLCLGGNAIVFLGNITFCYNLPVLICFIILKFSVTERLIKSEYELVNVAIEREVGRVTYSLFVALWLANYDIIEEYGFKSLPFACESTVERISAVGIIL